METLAPLFRLENNLPDEYPAPPTTLKINKTNTNTSEISKLEFNIVGVYVDVNNDFGGDSLFNTRPLMFSKAGFDNLGVNAEQGEFARIIAPQKTGIFATNSLAKYMSETDGLNLKWYKNDVLSGIEQNKDSLKDFSNLFLYVSIALAIFSIFMLFNYISSSIVSKKQSIGVLRALDSNGKDIFTMFTAESLFISIVNAILANIMAFIGCIFVNMYIKNIMHLTINFAIFGFRQIIIISAISIITGIISSLIPIIRICKEKPIELIRKD
jgi:ABC-type antimicrobial peptide transport system permease subunit